jgi:pimeloyl-ACP methyl ester carboxylesterase
MVRTRGGRGIRVVEAGSGQPSVIFDSGAGVGASYWSSVQARVSEQTTTLAYDRAGQGASDPLAGQWTIGQLVEDLEDAVTAVGLPEPYVVVGHSFGGHVIRMFTARHPEVVVGMVLVDARPTRIDERCPAWRDWARAEDADLALDQAVDDANSKVEVLPDLGGLPLVVITHGIADMIEPGSGLGPEIRDEFERAWQSLQREHVALSRRGRLVIAQSSGHMIADFEPEIVSAAVLELTETAEDPS